MNAERLRLIPCSPIQAKILEVFEKEDCIGATSRTKPCEEISAHLANLNCNAVVLQDPVLDPDFLAEYLAYYAKGFAATTKYCKRLHFFTLEPLPAESALDFIDRASTQKSSYLGFVTVRPIKSCPIAASILVTPPSGCFVLCDDKFSVHLAGQEFEVVGTPFMQQDNAVGACAQASIWMALRTLRRREGFSALDPAEITSAATKFLVNGRTLPNRTGLSIHQMIEAVRFAGYSTHYLHIKEAGHTPSAAELLATKEKIYTYIESGIPVLLGLFRGSGDGHAVVTIGHGWDPSHTPTPSVIIDPKSTKVELVHASSWINNFYIHNDNSGPYMFLLDNSLTSYCLSQACFAIPLLPNDVFITGEEASETAKVLLSDLLDASPFSSSELAALSKQLVIRTFLSDRHKFREWALKSSLSKDLKDYYRLKILPKRVWVTEICLSQNYNDESSHSAIRVGEIIVDPTGDPYDSPFLAIHLNTQILFKQPHGVVWDRDQEGKMKIIAIANDAPYDRYHKQ